MSQGSPPWDDDGLTELQALAAIEEAMTFLRQVMQAAGICDADAWVILSHGTTPATDRLVQMQRRA